MISPRARRRPDPIAGRAAAIAHADRVTPFWSANALEHVRAYALTVPTFMGEDVRVWATARGLSVAPSERSWGAVMGNAVRQGIVEQAAMGKTIHSTGGWVAIWRSLICTSATVAPHDCPACRRPL